MTAVLPHANPTPTPTQPQLKLTEAVCCRVASGPNRTHPNPIQPNPRDNATKVKLRSERSPNINGAVNYSNQPHSERTRYGPAKSRQSYNKASATDRQPTSPQKCMSSTLVYITFRERHRNQVRERAIAINIPRCHHYRQPRTALDTGIAPGGPHLSCDMTALPAPRTLYYPAVCFRTGPSGCLILWCLLLRQLSRKNMRTARPCSVAERI